MKTKSRMAQLAGVVICAVAVSSSAEGASPVASIDPLVLDEFAAKGEATFWVLFRERADLSPAFEIRDWDQRGRFVYGRLVETAEQSQAGVRELLSLWGAESKPFWITNAIMVTIDDSALVHALAARPEVAEIRASPEVELIEMVPGEEQPPERTIEWNIERIRAPLVWSTYGVQGEGIVVASIDRGVQYDHPALVEQYRGNLGGGVFDHNYNWYDPSGLCDNPPNVPCDAQANGHGTYTIGLAVGDDGGSNQIGVAPGARFIAAAVIGGVDGYIAGGQWMLAPTDLNGANPRPDLRPHVINNSWGLGSDNDFYEDTIQAWIASGIFSVFAIGNNGPACNTSWSPGEYEIAYGVGNFDINNNIRDSSSRGPSHFDPDTIKPDITAPGVDVRSCVPVDDYGTGTGTSASAPHVAGTVALMWSLHPELIREVEATRQLLDHTAIDTSDLSCGGDPGNNNVWGEGRLDAFDAVNALLFIDGFESGDTSAWSATVP